LENASAAHDDPRRFSKPNASFVKKKKNALIGAGVREREKEKEITKLLEEKWYHCDRRSRHLGFLRSWIHVNSAAGGIPGDSRRTERMEVAEAHRIGRGLIERGRRRSRFVLSRLSSSLSQ
jgi:hypothetical protein